MNIITKTALSNLKQNKSRNILIGIAIMLTTLLLTMVPIIGIGVMNLQFATVNKEYPTYHGVFGQINEDNLKKMQASKKFETVGMRADPANLYSENAEASLFYYDGEAAELNRVKVDQGRMPEAADEIVVSQGLLSAMGVKGEIGDSVVLPYQVREGSGLGIAKTGSFKIVGLIADNKKAMEESRFAGLVSKAFLELEIPADQRMYKVYMRVAGAEDMTRDEIKNQINVLGGKYQVDTKNIVENSEYLSANYVDPVLYIAIVVILIIIILAGILTIYSVYYVSIIHKVQEFGKLKAIGATQKQIRKLVFREGFAVAAIAIPAGILLGAVGGYYGMHLFAALLTEDNFMKKTMQEVLQNHEITLIHPWILVLAAVVAVITVYFSLLLPMRLASRASAIEAISFHGEENKRKSRKGYAEISTGKLTWTNLERNKKRTAITILTLGITSILFMVIATVLSCASPEIMARGTVLRDFDIRIEAWGGDQMHPERELRNIQKNNPLNNDLKEQIRLIDGVSKIEERTLADVRLEEHQEANGDPFETDISGISPERMEEVRKYVKEGTIDEARFAKGDAIILSGKEFGLSAGDQVRMQIFDGDVTVRRTFEIVAVLEAPYSMAGYGFALPADVLQGMVQNNTAFCYDITADKSKHREVEAALQTLVDSNEVLKVGSFQETMEMNANVIGIFTIGCYGLMAVLGIVGILNLVNTMINSVYVRKKELGMLQALGLSDRQMIRMLQLEGMFYTAGTLFMALGAGNLAGYACFLLAKKDGLFAIREYVYPVVPTIVLVVIVVVVQLLLTYLVNGNFKKESLIDRIRFSQ